MRLRQILPQPNKKPHRGRALQFSASTTQPAQAATHPSTHWHKQGGLFVAPLLMPEGVVVLHRGIVG
ncbi:MAG: hypothetical protein QX192_04730 [Methylococcales bacterium]